jgi:hypothetical protein
MVTPLFILALAWERLGTSGRGRLRGREIQVGPVRRHVSVVISSVLFIVLGIAFIAFQGGNALGSIYEAVGAADVALQIESRVRDLATRAPLLLAALVVLPITALAAIAIRVRRTPQPQEEIP